MATNNFIKILDNFEGAMIGDYSIKNENIFMQLKKEKPTFGYSNKKFDYNLHFHFGIQNQTNKKIVINIFIECKSEGELHQFLPRLWISSDINNEYRLRKDIVGKTDFHGKYFLKLHLDAKQILYVANFPPIRFSKLKKIFRDLSAKSHASEITIGRTIEDRNIKAYEYGNIKDKPTILFVAGFHPPERDTIAIEAIMEKLSDNQWRENILKKYSFSLIPILNPDGFAKAMQGSNVNEINFHWKFFGNSKDNCPEAFFIWEYCLRIKPIVFFDFHAFTFQDNTARPYLIPKGYYISRKAKLIQNSLNEELIKLCDDRFSFAEKILVPNLLSTGLRDKFGTITVPKFHLHMKDGIDEVKKMATQCLEIIFRTLRNYGITSGTEILKKPYGELKPNICNEIRIKILNYWYLKIKTFMKNIF